MLIALIALSLWTHASGTEARWIPEFQAFKDAAGPVAPFLSEPQDSRIEEIRVQIFPHIGRYVAPQGRDTVVNSVSIRATRGQCRAFEGPGAPPLRRSDYTRPAKPLATGSLIALEASKIDHPLWVECDGSAELLRTGYQPFRYSGAFFVETFLNGTAVRVVLILPFEEYLKGVVPAEMPAGWQTEALKAQAVAARSYGIYQVTSSRLRSHSFDVDDTVLYQAFLGDSWRRARTNAAVDATRGEAVMYNGKAVKAYFSADSGGFTEDAGNVWPQEASEAPYCLAKAELYESDPASRWRSTQSIALIESRLAQEGLIQPGSRVRAISIVDRFASGRARTVRIELADRSTIDTLGTSFQRALRLKSSLFDFVTPSRRQSFTIEGAGWGHGVGMSQEGAQYLAAALQWDYRRILDFYYTGIEVRQP